MIIIIWLLSIICLKPTLRATSHTSQEPWLGGCESPKESAQRLSQDTDLQGVWSHMWPGPQPNVVSMHFYSCLVLTLDKIEWTNGVPWSPDLCYSYLQEVVFENSPSDHGTWSIRCHVGIHVDYTSIFLHSLKYSVGPSSVVWSSELGPSLPFPPIRVLESVVVRGSHSRVWSGP